MDLLRITIDDDGKVTTSANMNSDYAADIAVAVYTLMQNNIHLTSKLLEFIAMSVCDADFMKKLTSSCVETIKKPNLSGDVS